MNRFTEAELDAAYLASLVDYRASFTINQDTEPAGRLEVRLYPPAGVTVEVPWKWTAISSGMLFRNGEAAKLLTAVWPYLRNERRKAQAQECFKFTRTLGDRTLVDSAAKKARTEVRKALARLAE